MRLPKAIAKVKVVKIEVSPTCDEQIARSKELLAGEDASVVLDLLHEGAHLANVAGVDALGRLRLRNETAYVGEKRCRTARAAIAHVACCYLGQREEHYVPKVRVFVVDERCVQSFPAVDSHRQSDSFVDEIGRASYASARDSRLE